MDNNNNKNPEFLETGVDSEVSQDAFEQDPILEKYQTAEEAKHWIEELTASRKERKDFDAAAVKTIERYADKRSTDNRKASRYNLLFANVDTKHAALYARTPEPDISRRNKDADDNIGRVAGVLLERNLSYELEVSNFDLD